MDFGAQFGKCSSVYKEEGYSICKLPSTSAGIFRLSPYYGTVSSIGFSKSSYHALYFYFVMHDIDNCYINLMLFIINLINNLDLKLVNNYFDMGPNPTV